MYIEIHHVVLKNIDKKIQYGCQKSKWRLKNRFFALAL